MTSTLSFVALSLLAAVLGGCASYAPLPLGSAPAYAPLTVDAATLPPKLAAHPFDPGDGLDMTEVAMLAVANNPALRLARDAAHITSAQAFAASLLPDPQLSLSADRALGVAAASSAFGAGLGYQLSSLVSHGAAVDASQAQQRQADLALLWQEWQTIAQARLLFSRVLNQTRLVYWAGQKSDFLEERYDEAENAVNAGNLTIHSLNQLLFNYQSATQQLNTLRQKLLQSRQQLNALLGLEAGVELRLVEHPGDLVMPDDAAVQQALTDLPQLRPDLLALQAGYRAQDGRYRQAILNQFPALSLTLNRARDTSALYTEGVSLSLSLPFLNHNKGVVAVQKATRQRLHDQYQIRLNLARAGVLRTMAQMKLTAEQLARAEGRLKNFDNAARLGEAAVQAGNLSSTALATLAAARVQGHVQVEGLRQTLRQEQIALLTLLGSNVEGLRP